MTNNYCFSQCARNMRACAPYRHEYYIKYLGNREKIPDRQFYYLNNTLQTRQTQNSEIIAQKLVKFCFALCFAIFSYVDFS